MKYYNLNEIIFSIFSCFLLGSGAYIVCEIAKKILKTLLYSTFILIKYIESATKYRSDIENSHLLFKRIYIACLEFVFGSVVSIFFLLTSYSLLDGTIRVFSILSYTTGIFLAKGALKKLKSHSIPLCNFMSNTYENFLNVFFFVLTFPIRFVYKIIVNIKSKLVVIRNKNA